MGNVAQDGFFKAGLGILADEWGAGDLVDCGAVCQGEEDGVGQMWHGEGIGVRLRCVSDEQDGVGTVI